MRVTEFLNELPSLWHGDPQYENFPVDRRFRSVIDGTGGMATENKLALLNLAARFLEPDEIYLEVGAYRGTTIIGAALGNHHQKFVTIDNFSQFSGRLDDCRSNLSRYRCDNVRLINGDAWHVLPNLPFRNQVGVYFYDGRHMFRDQWAALEKIEPLLSDRALIIVDDTAMRRVAAANRLYTGSRSEFTQVARFTSSVNGEPRWWNGIELYNFDRRARGEPPSVLKERTNYLAHLVAYDLIRHHLGSITNHVGWPLRRKT